MIQLVIRSGGDGWNTSIVDVNRCCFCFRMAIGGLLESFSSSLGKYGSNLINFQCSLFEMKNVQCDDDHTVLMAREREREKERERERKRKRRKSKLGRHDFST